MRKLILLSSVGLIALSNSAALAADSGSLETVVVTAGLEGEIPQLLSQNGTQVDTIGGGVGRISYGDYTVLNIGARYFLDEARQHRIGLDLDNVFDEGYASHLARGTDIPMSSTILASRARCM